MADETKYGPVQIPGVPDDEPVFILRGQDQLTPAAIHEYADLCRAAGADGAHVAGVRSAADAIGRWQREHADRVKLPDTEATDAG